MSENMGVLSGGGRGIHKKRVKSGGGKGGKLRDLYGAMFKAAHMPPDVLAKQRPRLLFGMIQSLCGEEEEQELDVSRMSPEMKMFYGY